MAPVRFVDQLVGFAAVDIVVVDSVAALTPGLEMREKWVILVVGSQARLMKPGDAQRYAANIANRLHGVFLNQLRTKIGAPPVRKPGNHHRGNALVFLCLGALDIRRISVSALNGRPLCCIEF